MGWNQEAQVEGVGALMTEEPRQLPFYPRACSGFQVFSHSPRQNHACSVQIGPEKPKGNIRSAVLKITEKPQIPASLLTNGFRERPVIYSPFPFQIMGFHQFCQTAVKQLGELCLWRGVFSRETTNQEREKRGYKGGHTGRGPTPPSPCPLGVSVIQELPSWVSVSICVNVNSYHSVYQLPCTSALPSTQALCPEDFQGSFLIFLILLPGAVF